MRERERERERKQETHTFEEQPPFLFLTRNHSFSFSKVSARVGRIRAEGGRGRVISLSSPPPFFSLSFQNQVSSVQFSGPPSPHFLPPRFEAWGFLEVVVAALGAAGVVALLPFAAVVAALGAAGVFAAFPFAAAVVAPFFAVVAAFFGVGVGLGAAGVFATDFVTAGAFFAGAFLAVGSVCWEASFFFDSGGGRGKKVVEKKKKNNSSVLSF